MFLHKHKYMQQPKLIVAVIKYLVLYGTGIFIDYLHSRNL